MANNCEEIEIKPAIQILSATELTDLRNVDVEKLSLGLKRSVPEGTTAEADELQQLYDNLEQRLSLQRIESINARSLAVWCEDEQAVRVVRKDGRFETLGYSRNGQYFLEYFEALFLLEMGRLQLEYQGMIMCIEQAYLLLLGEEASNKYYEYLVYANFSRVGYIMVKHQNLRYDKRLEEATEIDCIWEILQNAILKKNISYHVQKSQYYNKIKTNMEQIKQQIVEQEAIVSKTESDTDTDSTEVQETKTGIQFKGKVVMERKRKLDNDAADHWLEAKKRCTVEQRSALHESFIDFLKNEPEYKKFKETFEKFDVVQLKAESACNYDECRNLKINFDLYLHNDGFRKSVPKAPKFRVIILTSCERFPNHDEISKCYLQQKHAVPLLVISVSESKQIHAFLYYFT